MSIRVNFVSQSLFSTDAFFFFSKKEKAWKGTEYVLFGRQYKCKNLVHVCLCFFFSFLFFLSQLVLSA